MTNKNIPFLNLGFMSLADMLRSIPGVFIKNIDNGRLITVNSEENVLQLIEITNEKPVASETVS